MIIVRRVVSHPLEEVVEGMQSRILARFYPVDSRLPSEAELQQEWGVSRSVVREAMKMLASKGLVRIEQGRGTFVNLTDTAPLRQQLEWVLLRDGFAPIDQRAGESLDQWDALLDVRTVLEVAVAERAAQHIQDVATLTAMREAIAAMRIHADDGVACSEDDLGFHVALARATYNPLYPFADRRDRPRAFVTEDGGQRIGRELVAEDEIGVAHADPRDPHQHLARARSCTHASPR